MYNEMFNVRGQKVRNLYKNLDNWLSNQNINALMRQSIKAEELFRKVGITFNVYGEDEAEERLIPFDLMPRIIDSKEWNLIEKGITQRLIALNMFLEDVYSKQNIVKENKHKGVLFLRSVNGEFRWYNEGDEVKDGKYEGIILNEALW